MVFYLRLLIFSLVVMEVTAVADDPPSAPFEVVWNVRTNGRYGCLVKRDIDVNVQQYGMIENSDVVNYPHFDGGKGDQITIFYIDEKWPHITDDDEYINGGIPQFGDVDADMDKLKDMINERIPDENFEGLGVLDFERWRPLYSQNFEHRSDPSKNGKLARYRIASRKKVEDEYPDWTAEQVATQAELEFDEAAKLYFQSGIQLAKEMRPNGKWGYYIYPLCHNNGQQRECKDIAFESNEKLHWLAEESGAFFPSAYFKIPAHTPEEERPLAYGANSIGQAWTPHKPVYTYHWFVKTMTSDTFGDYYTTLELINSIGLSADQGVDGIVFWGNAHFRKDAARCTEVKNYVDDILGPYVQRVLDFTRQCSTDLCSSNGRCVKYIETDVDKIDQDINNDHVYDEDTVKLEYECRCYSGWSGNNCTTTE